MSQNKIKLTTSKIVSICTQHRVNIELSRKETYISFEYEIGSLMLELVNSGLSEVEAQKIVLEQYTVSSDYLYNAYQTEFRNQEVNHAIYMGSDMGPCGNPFNPRF